MNDLQDISKEHMIFVRELDKGKTASDAYRVAFPSDNPPESIWASASRLKGSVTVQVWLNALKRETLAKDYTIDMHLEELEELKQLAISSGNMGAAVNATVSKGKATGQYVERKDIAITNTDDINLIDLITEVLGPDVADKALKDMGYEDTKH